MLELAGALGGGLRGERTNARAAAGAGAGWDGQSCREGSGQAGGWAGGTVLAAASPRPRDLLLEGP